MSKKTTSSKSLIEKLDEQVKKSESQISAVSESADNSQVVAPSNQPLDLYQQMTSQLSAHDPLKLKLEDQLLKLTDENAELTEKIAQYIQEAEELRKAPQQLSATIVSQKKEIVQLKGAMTSLESRLQSLAAENAQLKVQCATLNKEVQKKSYQPTSISQQQLMRIQKTHNADGYESWN